jgi:hypothetical protein
MLRRSLRCCLGDEGTQHRETGASHCQSEASPLRPRPVPATAAAAQGSTRPQFPTLSYLSPFEVRCCCIHRVLPFGAPCSSLWGIHWRTQSTPRSVADRPALGILYDPRPATQCVTHRGPEAHTGAGFVGVQGGLGGAMPTSAKNWHVCDICQAKNPEIPLFALQQTALQWSKLYRRQSGSFKHMKPHFF